MSNKHRLQFSIGPVQSFVAQSRRTRDLWSSSFLLSHLAATAIEEVKNLSGTLVLPHADSLTGKDEHSFGSIPNRFIADFDGETANESMQRAKAAACEAERVILAEWRKIAAAVWETFVKDVAKQSNIANRTQDIWDRQVESFWEIMWVVGTVEQSGSMLAARKNWRFTSATVEAGDHCTMMGDRQELSGWIRSREEGKQVGFWSDMRNHLGKLDLGEDERLCAIALIKRMFPKVAKDTIGREINQTNWPSTAYISAIPWLATVANSPGHQANAAAYAASVREHSKDSLGERFSTIPALNNLKEQSQTGDFLNLDGNFFQRAALANKKVTPFQKLSEGIDDAIARRALQRQLDELCKAANCKPSAYYAMLLMDGDSMGALLEVARDLESAAESTVSKALTNFSRAVPDIIGQHLGVTVYAGGDDVLAMLPLEHALKCAMQLAEDYREAFREVLGNSTAELATLSGAIVYAHYHTPLRDVLRTAHHLLDDVAKDATGRASLAIAVFKSSGITAQWAAPWDHIRDVGDKATADNIIDALIADLGIPQRQSNESGMLSIDPKAQPGLTGAGSIELSSSFLYNVRERYSALTHRPLTKPGEFGKLSAEMAGHPTNTNSGCTPTDGLLKSVLVADLMRARQHQDESSEVRTQSIAERNAIHRHKSEVVIDRLLRLSQRVTRVKIDGSDPPKFKPRPEYDTLGFDGALLVRFLAADVKEDSE